MKTGIIVNMEKNMQINNKIIEVSNVLIEIISLVNTRVLILVSLYGRVIFIERIVRMIVWQWVVS